MKNEAILMHVGGIVLCGGRSSRMGLPKATLPFGPELMLQRVVRILGQVVDPLVVVAAVGQELPDLPPDVLIVRDAVIGRGPLQGLYGGLAALQDKADAAYATSCDVPLLEPAFVRQLIEWLADHQIVVPVEDAFQHPLAAVYRTELVPEIRRLLSADRLRPVFLFDQVRTLRVPTEELRAVDPELGSLANLNYPQDYVTALRKAGFEPPDDVITRLGVVASGP